MKKELNSEITQKADDRLRHQRKMVQIHQNEIIHLKKMTVQFQMLSYNLYEQLHLAEKSLQESKRENQELRKVIEEQKDRLEKFKQREVKIIKNKQKKKMQPKKLRNTSLEIRIKQKKKSIQYKKKYLISNH